MVSIKQGTVVEYYKQKYFIKFANNGIYKVNLLTDTETPCFNNEFLQMEIIGQSQDLKSAKINYL